MFSSEIKIVMCIFHDILLPLLYNFMSQFRKVIVLIQGGDLNHKNYSFALVEFYTFPAQNDKNEPKDPIIRRDEF